MHLTFFPTETEQYLALPWATSVLPQLWDHQQLFEDKLKQSRIGARLGIKMPRQDVEGVDSLLSTDSSSGEEYFDMDFQGFYFSDGKPEPISITDPIKDTFQPLVQMTLEYIAVGMGYSYQLLTSDLSNANFAATRANIIEDNAVFRDWYQKFTRISCQPKWNKFVEWEIKTGRLAKYGITPDVYDKDPFYYNRAIWLPTDTREWVDPLKDMEALVLAYKTGQITYQEMCARQGKDWRSMARQLRTEREFMQENGLYNLLPENIDNKNTNNSEAVNANKNEENQQ
jgi:capsid protein